VFEAAGGYSPTMGIIGAVLGLIQVMKNLANIDEVGRGIATAFVATIYGLVAANLVFLPLGTKIKARAQGGLQIKELILEGVSGIVEGLNPKLIRLKLEAYGQGGPAPKKAKAAKGAAKPAADAETGAGERLGKWPARRSLRPREQRALAALVRGFHHAAVRVLRGDVRQLASR